MTRLAATLLALLGTVLVTPAAQVPAAVEAASRTTSADYHSILMSISGVVRDQIDDIEIELRNDDSAREAVPLRLPSGWTATRNGRTLRLRGTAVTPPVRLHVALFDDRAPEQLRVRLRRDDRQVWDGRVKVAAWPALVTAARPAGFLQMPAVVSPGGTIEMEVLDPARTPPDGQWFVAGVRAEPAGERRIRVSLPDDLAAGAPVRVSYFDVWGAPVIDAVTVEDVDVTAEVPAAVPRITDCARFGILGQSICVCGDFPGDSGRVLTIDGQPAAPIAVSRHVVHLRLPEAIGTGAHVIGGPATAGFAPANTVMSHAVALRASIDVNALMRGQSTTMRVALDGAPEPLPLSITNRTPAIVSLEGGNYQEVEVAAPPVEIAVGAVSVGNFLIDATLAAPACPCLETRDDHPSNASRATPLVVPRRVLATIAVGTPAALLATAETVAAANGLAVVSVTPLTLTADALAVFEIVDGVDAVTKAGTLAADPNVTGTQPDFIYDTFQGAASPSSVTDPITYPQRLIGADVAQQAARGDGVRVAIVDAGIDVAHPRLKDRLAEYTDITGTGWTPDVHGTLVAGVIAASEGDGAAPAGVAPNAQLVGVKACVPLSRTRAAARCWSSTLARGIDLAAGRNVRVMNVSVGGPADRLLGRLVAAALGKGIAIVSAAGNDGPDGRPSYPAASDGVIAVTAVDATGTLYPRATRGTFIDLAAPGVDIMSTGPGGRNQLFSGTSAATAVTSGSVALLLERRPLSLDELRLLLGSTARDLGESGRDGQFGDGLIDVCRAMAKLTGSAAACRP